MSLSKPSVILVTTLITSIYSGATAQQFCRPRIAVTDARLSMPEAHQRAWTAQVDIDASPCSTSRGRFDIIFQREKENGPDVEFVEPFEWQTGPQQTGRIEISVDFWIDESVQSYVIGTISPCPCRK